MVKGGNTGFDRVNLTINQIDGLKVRLLVATEGLRRFRPIPGTRSGFDPEQLAPQLAPFLRLSKNGLKNCYFGGRFN